MVKKENKKLSSIPSENNEECYDKRCPFHGSLSIRGRIFQGKIVKLKEKNLKIELERVAYVSKYERYLKKKTSLHAHIPQCLRKDMHVGDIIEIEECRPLSKTIHHVVIKIIKKISEIGKEFEEEKMEKAKEEVKKKLNENKGEEK